MNLTQDRISNKKLLKRQTKARLKSDSIITNSDYFITSDNYSIDSHKYLLPLPVNPIWEKTSLQVKNKDDARNLIAIFVGAFNETKGWQEVKKIIENSLDIEFILVSKYSDDFHGLKSETLKRCRIYRNLEVSELVRLVDDSDYIIIGSPFETQCLAAMEAAVRNKPVCMRKTGILATLPEADRQKVGVFNDDLVEANRVMTYRLKNEFESFQPKLVMTKYKLHSEYLRSEWANLILEELKESFLIKTAQPFKEKVRKKLPNPILAFLRRLKRLI